MSLDPGRYAARRVQECEDLGVRHERQDVLEDELAPAHAGQPVVHDRDPAAADVGRWDRRLVGQCSVSTSR